MNNILSAPSRELEVPAGHAGRRLDKFLRSQLKGVPVGLIFRLLRKGAVRVNGKRVTPDYRLRADDLIRLPALEIPRPHQPRNLPAGLLRQVDQAICHEDDSLIVLNKPADLAVHAGTGVSGGVIEALRQLRPHEPDLELVHRIDKETSGLLMVARTPAMLRHLQEMMRDDSAIERRYLALVRGSFPEHAAEVRAPLLTTDTGVRTGPQGQPARTRFQVLAPVVRARKGEFVDLFKDLAAQGYARVRVDGEVYPLSEPPILKKQIKHDIDVVVDRLQVKESQQQRLTDSVETALGLADGLVALEFIDRPAQRHRIPWQPPQQIVGDMGRQLQAPRTRALAQPLQTRAFVQRMQRIHGT